MSKLGVADLLAVVGSRTAQGLLKVLDNSSDDQVKDLLANMLRKLSNQPWLQETRRLRLLKLLRAAVETVEAEHRH